MSTFRKTLIWLLVVYGICQIGSCHSHTAAMEQHDPAFLGTAPTANPFDQLRLKETTPREDYWRHMGEALRQLETIEGAAYDARYGVVTLHGKPATGRGPFHLDDLMVALKAVYFSNQSLGMTIDPDPKDPYAPEMIVRYFGGCENTAFGWVLFECDRLLKSMSNGQDTLSGMKLTPDVPRFMNMLQLTRAIGTKAASEWNRFWLAMDKEEGPTWRDKPRQSNPYQPILYTTQDGSAISFHRCRLFLRTELMALNGGTLVSVKGRSSKAAEAFANHFIHYFDDFSKKYPEFARAAALSRLVVLAEWLKKTQVPLDLAFIRSYRQQYPVLTPTVTPATTASLETNSREGDRIVTHIIKGFGGVDFNPRGFYASDAEGAAEGERTLAREGLARHHSDVTWTMDRAGTPVRIVTLPTVNTAQIGVRRKSWGNIGLKSPKGGKESPAGRLPNHFDLPRPERTEYSARLDMSLEVLDEYRLQPIRGPPTRQGETGIADSRYKVEPGTSERSLPMERIDTPMRSESSNRKVSSDARTAKSTAFTPLSERAEVRSRQFIPLKSASPLGFELMEAPDGSWTYGLPKIFEYYDPIHKRTIGIHGKPESEIRVADQLTLTSEVGDICVTFGDPQIDQKRVAMYYPAASPYDTVLVGYYPKTRSLLYTDGTRTTFDEDGNPVRISIATGTQLEFTYSPEVGHSCYWPRPTACRVSSTAGRAESGTYRMMDLSGRPR